MTILFLAVFTLPLLLTLPIHHITHTHHHAPAQPSHHLLHLLPTLRTAFTLTTLAALATRLAWTYNPSTLNLEIASLILTSAAPIFLLIANLLLARRFLRDYAAFGLHPAVIRLSRLLVLCAIASLAMGVSVLADAYFTDPGDADTLQEVRVIGLVARCIRVVLAVVPVAVVLVGGLGFPAREEVERERRRFGARGGMVCFVGGLLTLEDGFWTGVGFEGRGVGRGAWFLSKACLYCFGFLVPAVVVYTFLAARVDSRFRVRPREGWKEKGRRSRYERLVDRMNTEMEVFGYSG